MWRPIARWPFQTWPVVVDPVVDDPNGANFKKGLNATLRHYTLHSNAHTTNYRTPVMIVILQSSHPAQSLSATASNNQFAELPPSDCKVVSVISATAPWFPKLSGSDKISFNERRFSNPGDRHWFTEKIRFVLRLASKQRQDVSGPRSHRLHEQLSTIYGRT